eukprot:scaffold84_cov388-Prasinococcus_capsulatus_cf.AAC.8
MKNLRGLRAAMARWHQLLEQQLPVPGVPHATVWCRRRAAVQASRLSTRRHQATALEDRASTTAEISGAGVWRDPSLSQAARPQVALERAQASWGFFLGSPTWP